MATNIEPRDTAPAKRAPHACAADVYGPPLAEIAGSAASRQFTVRFWDGSERDLGRRGPRTFTLVIRHPAGLRHLLLNRTEIGLADAYMHDMIDIEGDLEAAIALGDDLVATPVSALQRLRWMKLLLSLPRGSGVTRSDGPPGQGAPGSLTRTKDAVNFHYDLPETFWSLWLDTNLVYSCGYYRTVDDSIDDVQTAKLDHIFRKLDLQPGDRLLDIGCGWGALVIHAARYYGALAHGITLSAQQAAYATRRIEQLGLSSLCSVAVKDFRELSVAGDYDKVVSVGMVEHVREEFLGAYFRCAANALRPGGRFLSHGITCPELRAAMRRSDFMQRYAFPDTHLVPVSRMLAAGESAGLEARDVESLREHYALTTRTWHRRLEAVRDQASRVVDRAIVRKFQLLLAGTAHNFTVGRMNLHQVLFVKPIRGVASMPLTRAAWYANQLS